MQRNGVYIWHVETDDTKACHGRCCGNINMVVFGKDGLHDQSPCILGWPASIRKAQTPLASYIPLDTDLANKRRTNIQISITPQATLGVNLGVFTGSFTASPHIRFTRYKGPKLNDPETGFKDAQRATVLIYCEHRKVHLVVDAADLIETICLRRLKDRLRLTDDQIYTELGFHEEATRSDLPRFVHSTAEARMKTWLATKFTATGNEESVYGKDLVEEASKAISLLIEKTTEHPKLPLYWPLAGLLSGTDYWGLETPKFGKDRNWLTIWRARPIVVIAVGYITDEIISHDLGAVKWNTSSIKQ
jgi:hypothetical protein